MSDARGNTGRVLDIRAGVLGAVVWCVIGALAAAVAVAVLDLNQSYLSTAMWPVLGCGAVFACAGWAARSSRPARGFVRSLIVVFFGSIVLWTVLAGLELTPRRLKSVEHPLIYPSEAVVLLVPPVLMAVILTALRRTDGSG
jgi:hypothetical protein